MANFENRPWGRFDILLDTPKCKVKIIEVKPNQRLSYQYHKHRAERWVVVEGTLTVILNDVEHTLNYGDCIDIPKGDKHRAWNKTENSTKFIETQIGTYFGEDDIVRVSDDYNRTV